MKKFGLILVILTLCAVLASCGEAVVVSTPGGDYEFRGAQLVAEYQGETPQSGMMLLAVSLRSSGSDLSDAETYFFSREHSSVQVSDGAASAVCRGISYSKETASDPGFTATLLFDVPADFAQEFTLSGDNFNSVTVKRSR